MAYETPITIKKAIDHIKKRHYVLPSIQREFVWDTEQIEKLFDSLMRDYPISTFLFWKVDKNKIKDFQFYEFLKNYHEKDNRHNRKAELGNDEDVIALLDGQQRMTSLYLSLTGSYAQKIPYFRWESPHAFPKKKLYLNLLSPSEDLELEYDFRFLTEEDANPKPKIETQTEKSKNEEENNSNRKCFWFECGNILDITEVGDLFAFLTKNDLMNTAIHTKEQADYAGRTLNKFFNVIHQKGTISYYLEEGEELDKVLQIFIRINSGGTKLSYSDLLLSIATAQWKDKDARQVIHEFVDEINKIGDGFSFNKDFVLKACIVLADFKDVKFHVDNFTKANMATIEKNWDKVSSAVLAAIQLASKFGYSRDNLIATNTIIPIAYFIYKNQFDSDILHGAKREDDRKSIKEWLARVLLKGTFGGQPDSIYPVMRNLIISNAGKFPLKEVIDHYRGTRKSIAFTEDEIENLLAMQYGKAQTYCALSLLYPSLNYNFKYHQDHIHPKSFFTKTKLKRLGISDDQVDLYSENFNSLANLQLLQATQNIVKSDKHFDEWLKQTFPSIAEQESFLMQNHIKLNESLSFDDFLDFVSNRRTALKNEFMKILDVAFTSTVQETATEE